jgi:Flp pilus assembly protein TadG
MKNRSPYNFKMTQQPRRNSAMSSISRRIPTGKRPAVRGGGAIVEAVLVMSLILSLTLGAAEYSYAFYLKHALQSAAAVGVRTAILTSSSDAAVRTAITNQLTLTNMQNIPYTLTTSPTSVTGCAAGVYVTVTLSVTWGNVGVSPLPVSMGGFPASKVFSSAASMVHE